MRVETDMVGSATIDEGVYYGLQTLRASENFHITGRRLTAEFIDSLAEIKKAAALVNGEDGRLAPEKMRAIVQACDEILSGKFRNQFITDAIQGGAGTSANMNVNEVVANRAIEILGGEKGDYTLVHPNDHVNMSQSTNDVIPTAGKMTVLKLMRGLEKQLTRLVDALEEKAREFDPILKMGRTQMQDAVPIRLGQEFGAYRSMVLRDLSRMQHVPDEIKYVNMGGTAIGTSINADDHYVKNIVPALTRVSGLKLEKAANLIDATQNVDCFVAVSAVLRTCAVNLSKMANDLRILSSGPRTGFHEINLPPRQNGSSIMTGKVNPVIPEVVSQVAFGVVGNDVTISMAAEAGQLELNAFEPVIFYKLFESITTLTGAVQTLVDNCITGITANEAHCEELVEHSVGIITALCPYIGYSMAADIAKAAIRKNISVRQELVERNVLSQEQIDRYMDPYSMT